MAGGLFGMSKLSPRDPKWWTEARRREHSERLEAYYEAQEEESGWDAYIAATRGRQKNRRKAAANTRRVWAERSPAEREAISRKLRINSLQKKIDAQRASGGKADYHLILQLRRLTRGIQ